MKRTQLGEAMKPVHDLIVAISDRAGEALASMTDDDSKVSEQHVDNLAQLNLAIWRLRWELGITGGDVVEAEPVKTTAAGAS